ncbi:uncharacterized protein CYBJADRAFT_165302 [Cyberlindnera jadinii NRRL Y-1542]|uniref:Secreted protein n=1 Tax=Cyberlindnera jadinii (strain ATCC 18201 / CBS 1600 / BCRC 20928 / JCM 3617 / NBRC 0987 / NRRL Y-1542) TaxID=983966 RepID=A0A1E4S8R1_CYBJN|nr:hypothetical protein CYBJADRAFT_165302 [Cyberlindnera jadinii NRRL Y-1542]ODV75927.1 hypothetical protein CYBJADRAFT_165302 [Cyberlindnera jadinii NRRL Y-1542]
MWALCPHIPLTLLCAALVIWLTPSGLKKPCAHRANPPTNEPAANGQAFSTASEQSRHVQAGFLRYHLCSQ